MNPSSGLLRAWLNILSSHLSNLTPYPPLDPREAQKVLRPYVEESIHRYYISTRNSTILGYLPYNIFDIRMNAIFLTILTRQLYLHKAPCRLSDRIFTINRILHGCNIYGSIKLPPEFFLCYASNIVLGPCEYGNNLVVYQGVTTGSSSDIFPTFGNNVILHANVLISGNCRIGNNVTVAPGVTLVDTDVPDNMVVFRNNLFVPASRNHSRRYFTQ